MSDTLTISNLELWTRIGVPEEERAQEQRILVTLKIGIDTKESAKKDAVTKGSIDYFVLCNEVRDLAKTERKTIERLAEDIADHVLKNYKPASVDVEVKKFVIPGTDFVSISIKRL